VESAKQKTSKKMRITARYPNTLRIVDLEYDSIAEARKHNPTLIDFEVKGAR